MATSPAYYGDFGDCDQPTLNTVADYIVAARTELQDEVPDYRYDDASLLTDLNMTMLLAHKWRADLFVYNIKYKGQAPSFQAVDDTYVEIEVPFRVDILNGLIGHAFKRDQEDVQDQRATSYLNMFSMGLTGRAVYAVAGGSASGGGP